MDSCDGTCGADQIGLEALQPGPAVRDRLDSAHIKALAEVLDRVPPVLVSCPSRRLIDGYHRVAAARHRGETKVAVTWWHGQPEQFFETAVEANAAHGLPLTRRARRAAAEAMLRAKPETSDRRIAQRCGLAPTTVGDIRREIAASDRTTNPAGGRTVVGADGKRYRVPPPGRVTSPTTSRRVPWWRRALLRLWRWLTASASPDGPVPRATATAPRGLTQVSSLDT